jgi:signal transduction histidine kinase
MKKTDLIKKINKYFLRLPIIMIIVGIFISIFLITYEKNKLEQLEIEILQNEELTVQKDKLKTLVNQTINIITLLEQKHKQEDILKKLKLIAKTKLNYIFIYKLNYPLKESIKHNQFARMLININRPDLEGKLVSLDYKDIQGKEFRKEMLQKIIKNGEAFVTYYYKNPLTNKINKKLSYFKYYKPLNLIVCLLYTSPSPRD